MESLSHHLVHSLTAHMALYHSHSLNPTNPCRSPRASVLRWFSSLSPTHRQAAVTIFDPSFLLILLQMQYRIRCLGHSHFLLLHDLPSISSSPSLSFRPSRGLLSRYAASNSSAQILSSSMLFFCSSSSGANAADAITLSESLVADVDRFMGVMDGLSCGRFLCDDVELLGSTVQWMELPWLKDMGYYSLEAFVANRLELALRLAWISSQVGKKPKEKKAREKAAKVAGNAANAFWRMKSCGDWWIGLDPVKRKVIVSAFFGKAAYTLVNEIIKEEKAALRNGFGFLNIETNMPLQYRALSSWQKAKQAPFRRELYCTLDFLPVASSRIPNSLTMAWKKLIVICDIANMLLAWQLSKDENENFFFSSLGSTLTISDHILRKLQRLLMVVHTDFINHELMDDSKLSTYSGKAEEKCNLVCQRGKSKSRTSKNTAIPKAYKICSMSQEPSKENTRVSVDSKRSNGKKKSRRKDSKNRSSNLKKIGMPKLEGKMDTVLSVAAGREPTETVGFICTLHSYPKSVGMSDMGIEEDHSLCFIKDRISESEECHPSSGERENDIPKHISPCLRKFEESQGTINQSITYLKGQIDPIVETIGRISVCACELDNVDRKNKHQVSCIACSTVMKSFVPLECFLAANDELNSVVCNGSIESYAYKASNSLGGTSYDRPSITPFQLTSINSHLPAAMDRLNLDADNGYSYQLHHSFLPSNTQVGSSSGEFLHSQILPSLAYPMSYDWPPMVQNCSRLSQTLTVSNEGLYSQSMPLSSSYSGLDLCAAHGEQVNVASGKNEVKHAGDIIDAYDTKNISDLVEDTESYWLSEEEFEIHSISGRDYNKFFGGGVMYWNPAEFVGTGFSRPPSHSSEDSSWAWHDADLNRTIDDMVGGKSGLPTAYNTNGIISPSSSYCLSFDHLPSGHQSMGYAVVGNDGSSNVVHSSTLSDPSDEKISSSTANSTVGVEGVKGDPPHPMLRPIIIPGMSRKVSRSDFKVCCGHKSPCLPSTRRDTPQIKRPPSPVVLCVPSVPRPPPPSPIGESKRRGFPIVRSGSSSPRHWGVKSWFHEESNVSDPRLCLDGAEVAWPTWARKGHGVTAVAQSLPGSLLQDHLITISKIAHDQEHPDIALPLQPPDLLNGQCKGSLSMMHNFLHEEIDFFCKQVAAENLIRKPYINWAVRRVTRALQVLWPRSRTNVFGSNVTGLALPTSDVDLVVSLPPVRNLEPIKEAGILEGRNGIKETCLQHAARYLANQDWVRNDSLKTVENTAIPVIMLVAEVPCDMTSSNGIASIVDVSGGKLAKMYGEHSSSSHLNLCSSQNMLSSKSSMTKDDAVGVKSICLDISFKSTSHTGLQTSELVKELSQQFPASVPLALVLKKFLADRSLDHSYSGGLSSYCLVLLITRFLQHEHHSGHSTKQNLGSLFMDFLYFFGNVFDPRQMRISIQGSGVYIKRERCLSIDPIHIDDPLFPTNNVGRNCFRIHQCIKAFADAYATLENELTRISDERFQSSAPSFRLLQKIIPSIDCGE